MQTRRFPSRPKFFLHALVLFVISSLLLSASGTPVFARGVEEQKNASSAGLDQCLNDGAEVGYSPHTGKVRFLGTLPGMAIKQPITLDYHPSPETAARSYLSVCGSLFGVRDQAAELTLKSQRQTEDGRFVLRFSQVFQGIAVFGAELVVQLDADNNIILVNGDFLPDISLTTVAAIATPAAEETALQLVAAKSEIAVSSLQVTDPVLMVYDPGILQPKDGPTILVWQMEVTPLDLAPIHELVLVDAQSGMVVLDINQVDTAKNRLTFTAGNTETRPGTLVCDETDPTCAAGDADAAAAHIYSGDTYDFYASYHGRDSIDNAGMDLISTVHFSSGYCNAFWDGYQMTYGDGCFIVVDDVVAHEMTHGVTENESNLIYSYQSGAINESFSDIWGEFVDLTNGKGDDTPDVRWYMGEEVSGGAIRYMADPTIYGDPDKMTSPYYYYGSGDNGGVHYNSGVGNKAAYLITDGDEFNGYTVIGIGITKAAKIYYEAQTNLLVPTSDYGNLYDVLYQACLNLVGTSGITSGDCTQVRNATLATEMDYEPSAATNDDFDSAIVISSLAYANTQNSLIATTAADDPYFTCGQGTQHYYSVWYRYTPAASENLVVDTIGSSYDTVLAIWTGSRGSLVPVACNDDSSGLQSQVQISAGAGITYYIEIASYSAGAGNLTLNAYESIPPIDMISGEATSMPTLDGIISGGEWDDALTYDISNPLALSPENIDSLYGLSLEDFVFEKGKTVLALANNVTLYLMNDGTSLYMAFDNPNDTVSNIDDQIGVYFDDNPLPSDGYWTNTSCGNADGEGNFWLLDTTQTQFREWISGPTACGVSMPASGVTGYFGFGSGHAQAEIAIDLTSSALRAAPGDVINMYLWMYNYETSTFEGQWPLGASFDDPSTYDPLTLSLAGGSEISGYVTEGSGPGIGGVSLLGLPNETYTDSDGYYSSTVPENWSGTVTPQKDGFTFSPASITYTNVITDQSSQNYAASCASGLLCIFVSDTLGNPVEYAEVEVFVDYDEGPIGYAETDSSGLAVMDITAGDYQLLVSSTTANFLVTKEITAPGFVAVNPSITNQVTVTARKLDGSPLQDAMIIANPSAYSFGPIGFTDSLGSLTAQITPGTYTFMVWSWDDYYYLSLPGVYIGGTTDVQIYAAAMPTGQMPITLTDFDYVSLGIWSQYSEWMGLGYANVDGDQWTLSAGNYNIGSTLIKVVPDTSTWYYDLEGFSMTLPAGGSYPLTVGGDFTISTDALSDTYLPGATVSITNLITDAYANPLFYTSRYEETLLPLQKERLVMKDAAGEVKSLSLPGFKDAAYTYTNIYPYLAVTNPLSTIISSAEDYATWYGHEFILPADSLPGTYAVDLTLDTGPHMGIISASDTFSIPSKTLTVVKTGEGSGTITSLPAGISCGADCTENYVTGTVVKLTATAAPGSLFTGWTGPCTGLKFCWVTMSASKTVTASFTPIPAGTYPVTVVKAGTGSGVATSLPAGIDCGTDCWEFYVAGTVVKLSAVASPGSTFVGWSGACGSMDYCWLRMGASKYVTANFMLTPPGTYPLIVARKGAGSGVVTGTLQPGGAPAGISCGTDCYEFYAPGTLIKLTAAAAPGSYFVGWSGACGGVANCWVTMSASRWVTALFSPTGGSLPSLDTFSFDFEDLFMILNDPLALWRPLDQADQGQAN